MDLRDYQEKCLTEIEKRGDGRWLVVMATGLGKTVVFANIKRYGRTLIMSHRHELVRQPIKYFQCETAIEQGPLRAKDEPVVSASVMSLAKRLDKFKPDAFHTIIIDEAHHSAAESYKKIIEHFDAKRILGFTATPNRADGAALDSVFDEIIFERDLRWGIENGWLANIQCMRVNIGCDLSGVRSAGGDFKKGELDQAVNIEHANKAIAEAYARHATGPTLIFAVTRAHAKNIADLIPGAEVVTGISKNRAEIFDGFKRGTIPCIVNVEVATEGVDLPNVHTIIMARPTKSVALYTQMVGRGTRLADGKKCCTLIDCAGNSRHDLCTVPSLIGIDASAVPADYQMDLVGDLLQDLPDLIEQKMDTPKSWIENVEIVNIWAKKSNINLRGINFFRHASGMLSVDTAAGKWIRISPQDLRGLATLKTYKGHLFGPAKLQECIDHAEYLLKSHASEEYSLWSAHAFRRWGKQEASDKQKRLVAHKCPGIDVATLTKGEASLILRRLLV